MELFEKLIPLILGMFKFNVNFDINVNAYIQNPKIILKRCLLITIIIVISHILSSTYEPSITITEEPSVTLTEEPSVTLTDEPSVTLE